MFVKWIQYQTLLLRWQVFSVVSFAYRCGLTRNHSLTNGPGGEDHLADGFFQSSSEAMPALRFRTRSFSVNTALTGSETVYRLVGSVLENRVFVRSFDRRRCAHNSRVCPPYVENASPGIWTEKTTDGRFYVRTGTYKIWFVWRTVVFIGPFWAGARHFCEL